MTLDEIIKHNNGMAETLNPSIYHFMDENKTFLDSLINVYDPVFPVLMVRTKSGFSCKHSDWLSRCKELGFDANKD